MHNDKIRIASSGTTGPNSGNAAYPNPLYKPQPIDDHHMLGVDLGPAVDAAFDPAVQSTSTRESVLREALMTVKYERASEYGDAKDNFNKIAALWRDAFGWDVFPYQVPLAMDLLKTARLVNNPGHRDSWVDKAGYSALGAEMTGDE